LGGGKERWEKRDLKRKSKEMMRSPKWLDKRRADEKKEM
jgi:hypothetical protein